MASSAGRYICFFQSPSLTCPSVTRVPYADQIVTLDTTGEIAEQGIFKELSAAGGYVSQFNLPEPDWVFNPKACEELAEYKTTLSRTKKLSTEKIEAEASRLTGHMKMYLYYAKSVGWLPFLIFVIAMAAFVFCYSFPSTSPPIFALP